MAKTIKQTKDTTPVKGKTVASTNHLTAKQFIQRLEALQSEEERKKIQRYFKSGEGQYGQGDQFMGVKMGQLFRWQKRLVKCRLMKLKSCWIVQFTK